MKNMKMKKVRNCINVKMKKCEIPNCTYYSDFTRCHKHAIKGDVNFNYGYKCEDELCFNFPYYGPIFGKRLRCSHHRLYSDVNLIQCSHVGCCKMGKYIKDGLYERFCGFHIPEYGHDDYRDMKKCKIVGCSVSPNYGNINDGIPIYCSKHKTDNEVNFRMENKVSKLCEFDGCKKEKNFGPAGKRLRCSEHRIEGDLSASRICKGDNGKCKIYPSFGPVGGNARLNCRKHRQEGEIGIHERTKMLEQNNKTIKKIKRIKNNKKIENIKKIKKIKFDSEVENKYITPDYIDDLFALRDVDEDICFGFNFENNDVLN